MFDKHPGYKRFTWVGNKISDEDMAALYQRKAATKKPITRQVAEAVSQYIAKTKKGENDAN